MAREKVMVNVQQGTFAVLNPDTDPDIVGMFTSGIGPCCHILVTNTQTGRSVLCHADAQTNILDAEYGLPSWIDHVCPNNDYRHLRVSIGETALRERGGRYYDAVTDTLSEMLRQPKHTVLGKIDTTNGKKGVSDGSSPQYGIEVNRKGIDTFISHDNSSACWDYDDKGITVKETTRVADLRDVLGPYETMPPLCSFDGQRDFSEADLIAQQPASLDPNRRPAGHAAAGASAAAAVQPMSKAEIAAEAMFKADYKSPIADDDRVIGSGNPLAAAAASASATASVVAAATPSASAAAAAAGDAANIAVPQAAPNQAAHHPVGQAGGQRVPDIPGDILAEALRIADQMGISEGAKFLRDVNISSKGPAKGSGGGHSM